MQISPFLVVIFLLLEITFSLDLKCKIGEYQCSDGSCIDEELRCDGMFDCIDGEDENHCLEIKCDPPLWFKCKNDRCIPTLVLCDGENDCLDLSDEEHCGRNSDAENITDIGTCSEHEFQCQNKDCIPKGWVCDLEPDCTDGSDETHGCGSAVDCSDGFRCPQSGVCIFKEFHCDGDNDCGDNSDEDNCTSKYHSTQHCVTSEGLYLCSDGLLCLDMRDVCDGFPHCFDKSDEDGCSDRHLNQTYCKSIGCSHDCHPAPHHPVCVCPQGFHLDRDLKTCIDVNECEVFGSCSQKCTNKVGSFSCDCDEGYTLAQDHRSCRALGGEPLLLFSSLTQIRGIYLESNVYFTVAKQLDHATGLAHNGHHVFWTAIKMNKEAIVRSNEDGSDQRVLVDVGLGIPEDLAVDYVTNNIYFTDPEKSHIAVCTETGLHCAVLHNTDIDKPRSLALWPKAGIMFWTDWGTIPKIGTSGMDGSNPRAFVSDDIHWPNGLTLDASNDRLYWVDAKAQTIETVRLDGTGRTVVLEKTVAHPYGIAVFEDMLYWSDWEEHEIQKCNKFTGKNHSSVVKERRKKNVYGVHIYHPALQPRVPNPCLGAFCSDICLLAPNSSYTCGCPEYSVLGVDLHTCRMREKRPVVVVGGDNRLFLVPTRLLGRTDPTEVHLPEVSAISCLTYNSLSGHVYLSDAESKKIFSYHIASRQLDTLIGYGIGKVTSMSFDALGNNLFFCDEERRVVEVRSLTTHHSLVLIKSRGGDLPISVVAVPQHGVVFVAIRKASGGMRIDMVRMDTQKVFSHVASLNIMGPSVVLTYDRLADKVFWTDSGAEIIESMDVHGGLRTVVEVLAGPPASLASLNSSLYWVQEGSSSLYWHDSRFNRTNRAKQSGVILSEILARLPVEKGTHLSMVMAEGVDSPHIHPCQHHNGGCSHLCLASGHDGRNGACACPLGLHLDDDGLRCITHAHCSDIQFKCRADDLCIPKVARCDGHADCPSGEDEQCETDTCTDEQFKCSNGQCIPLGRRCDYEFDCSDRSDEIACSANCGEGKFQCGSGECISQLLQCDFEEDCRDGSDEHSCSQVTCPPRMFQCRTGTCIPASWECDHEIECPDASDEHANCTKPTCKPDEFTCNNGRCISMALVCEGTNDCGDDSDEVECLLQMPMCSGDEFQCSTSGTQCVPFTARCNGTTECPRGEDETDCSMCQLGEFQCKNHRCIYRMWVCDHTDDCGDNSDEEPAICNYRTGVTSILRPCEGYHCRSGECLPYYQACNGHVDCSDGSDEGSRCEDVCKETKCEQECQPTPNGPVCKCGDGYSVAGDGHSCVDVDECLEERCAQVCSNTPGSFTCSCASDYFLKSDRLTCKATGNPMQLLLAGDDDVRAVSQNLNTVNLLLLEPGTQIVGLDVDVRRNQLYWSSGGRGSLVVMDLDSSQQAGIERVGRPGPISLDWVTGVLYLIDRGLPDAIAACHVAHKRCVHVFTPAGDTTTVISALVVDPLARFLFYSQSTKGKLQKPVSSIYRYEVGGGNATLLATGDISWVSGLVVDHMRRYLYWADLYTQVVERVRYDGSRRQVLFKEEVHRPESLTLFEDSLYWLTRGSGEMTQCHLYGEHKARCFHNPLYLHDVKLLTVLQAGRQPQASNPCANATCDHYSLCLTSPSGPQCVCEDGTVLEKHGHCEMSNEVLQAVDFPTHRRKYLGPRRAEEGQVHSASRPSGSSSAVMATLMTLLAVCTIFVAYLYVKKRKTSSRGVLLETMHFQNPSFGMSHMESAYHPKQLTPGEHEYENPGAKLVQHPDGKLEVLKKVIPVDVRTVEIGDYDSDSDSQYENVLDMTANLIP